MLQQRIPQGIRRPAAISDWSEATLIAVNQIGIAATLANTLFMGVVGGVIGSGAVVWTRRRDSAGEIVKPRYAQTQSGAPKIAAAADIA